MAAIYNAESKTAATKAASEFAATYGAKSAKAGQGGHMEVDLFAGLAVSDLQCAVAWFDRFFGDAQSFKPNDTEHVWTVAEHRYVYVELLPEKAGNAMVTLFIGNFDTFVDAVAERGIHPEKRETYGNGVRKAIYRDPDGNEISLGGAPIEDSEPS